MKILSLFLLATAVQAFCPLSIDRPVAVKKALSPLYYRCLDESDDDATMMQVQTRAPPGYNIKTALKQSSGMNLPLIRALLLNQGLILVLASIVTAILLVLNSGYDALSHLDEILKWTGQGPPLLDLSLTPERVGMGLAGALPILAFDSAIESSDNRVFANVNFATIVMVMTLFGRRTPPPPEFLPQQVKEYPTTSWQEVAFQSLVLSLVTGLCEETVFRRELPALIAQVTGSVPIALVGQAVIFGLGHVDPKGRPAENGVVFNLQFVNGLGFGLLYLLTGGDLLPSIIAHAFFDFVTFFKTWLDANGQIEYAEKMSQEPLSREMEQQVQRALRSSRMDPRLFNIIKRLFYTFDFDKNQTLSRSEVRKGIAYMAIEKAGQPPPQSVIDRLFDYAVETREGVGSKASRDRLSFADFVRLISMMNKPFAAVA